MPLPERRRHATCSYTLWEFGVDDATWVRANDFRKVSCLDHAMAQLADLNLGEVKKLRSSKLRRLERHRDLLVHESASAFALRQVPLALFLSWLSRVPSLSSNNVVILLSECHTRRRTGFFPVQQVDLRAKCRRKRPPRKEIRRCYSISASLVNLAQTSQTHAPWYALTCESTQADGLTLRLKAQYRTEGLPEYTKSSGLDPDA